MSKIPTIRIKAANLLKGDQPLTYGSRHLVSYPEPYYADNPATGEYDHVGVSFELNDTFGRSTVHYLGYDVELDVVRPAREPQVGDRVARNESRLVYEVRDFWREYAILSRAEKPEADPFFVPVEDLKDPAEWVRR